MEKGQDVKQNNWTLDNNNAIKDGQPVDKKVQLGNIGEILVGKRFEDFLTEVSLVGMKYVVLNGAMYVRKAIWLVCVLGGLGFMTYQFYDRISYFLSNPTTVTVTIKTLDELQFPTVTICNMNYVDKTRASFLPGFTDLITDIYPPWPDETFKPDFQTLEYLEEELNITNWNDIWYWVSPFIDPSLWEFCSFGNRACDMELVATEMGFCLQFNGEDKNFTVTQAGQTHGLWMVLNISQNDYLYAESRSAGVKVAIHEKHETPSFHQYSISAGPGQATSIGLSKKSITDLPYPYTECSDELGYSSYDCYTTCFENYIIDKCKCRKYYYSVQGYPTCDPEEMYVCVDPETIEYLNRNLARECNCSAQCTTSKFMPIISSAVSSEYAMDTIAALELNGACTTYGVFCEYTQDDIDARANEIQRDILELRVYFQDLKVEEVVTQKAYTTLALLCDIGGALGLILGATVLTLFEILDFGIVLLYDLVRFKMAKRQSRKLNAKF